MTLAPRTLGLLVMVLVLLAVQLLGGRAPVEEGLPRLRAVPRDAVTRIEVTELGSKMVLTRQANGWEITTPFRFPADPLRVDELLGTFRKELPMDLQVDSGEVETYGLDANDGVVVELFGEGEEPLASLTVGHDAQGGSSFVRLSGHEAVYRARVGGRARFAAPAADWRRRQIFAFDPARVVDLVFEVPGEDRVTVLRGAEAPWALEPAPPWPVDQRLVQALVDTIARARADDILAPDFDGGFEQPAARFEIGLDDGTRITGLLGGRRSAEATFVRLEGVAAVFRLPPRVGALWLRTTGDFRDKTLMAYDPRAIDTLALQAGRSLVLFRQDAATGAWRVIEPDTLQTDIKNVLFTARALSELRALTIAEGVLPGQAGLTEPRFRIEVGLQDGSSQALEVGEPVPTSGEVPLVYVRPLGKPLVYTLPRQLVDNLLVAFGAAYDGR